VTRRRSKKITPAAADSATDARAAAPQGSDASADLSWPERGILVVLLALIPLRLLAGESHTFESPGWLRHLDAPGGTMPATSLAIFALIVFAVAGVIAIRFWRGTSRMQWTGIEPGVLFLCIAGAVAIARAGQKHLAIMGVVNLLGGLLYLIALRQLLVRPWHIRLVLCVAMAVGGMTLAKAAFQRFDELPATIEYYEQHKDELIRNSPPQSAGFIHDYEQRLRAGAVTGYFDHANVHGSYLILLAAAALAAAASRLGRCHAAAMIVPLMIAVGICITAVGTQSKGAVAALAIAIVIGVVGRALVRRLAERPWLTWTGAWLIVLVAVGSFAALLRSNPEALGRSMLFRTMYWRGAANMIAAEGWLGVGPNNFGRHFARYKPVACPEDVEDPHGWPVKLLAEWGALGLAGCLVVLGGLSARLARRSRKNTHEPGSQTGSVILWTSAIGFLALGWWAGLVSGQPPAWVAIALLLAAVPWAVVSFLASADTARTAQFNDDDLAHAVPFLVGGLVAFLLHAGIDLALFNPAALTLFAAVAAVALAVHERPVAVEPRPFRKGAAAVTLAIGGGVAAVVFVALVRPAAVVAENLAIARRDVRPTSWDAYHALPSYAAYRRAADATELDGTALEELATELMRRVAAVEHVDEAIGVVRAFEQRDPFNAAVHHHRATLRFQRYRLGGDPADLDRAIDAAQAGVADYPSAPGRHLALAQFLEAKVLATGDDAARRAAIEALRAALHFDRQRIYVSQPNRLSDEQRAVIHGAIARLSEPGDGVPPVSASR